MPIAVSYRPAIASFCLTFKDVPQIDCKITKKSSIHQMIFEKNYAFFCFSVIHQPNHPSPRMCRAID